MTWTVVALVGVGAVALVVLVWARSRSREEPTEADPVLILGIALAATGAATIPTLGWFMVGVLAVGLVLMLVGIIRSRHRTG